MTESRYQRGKRRQAEKNRHETNIRRLTGDIVQDFETALDSTETPCNTSEEYPNPWTDWDSKEANREPYETEEPGRNKAQMLCSGCPLVAECREYALASNMSHGIWGGERLELGRWL